MPRKHLGSRTTSCISKSATPYNGISSINGGSRRTDKRRIEETEEEIIVVGHKVKKAKNIATYCKRAEKIATDDDKFMKDKKPIVLFGQGRKNDIRADCKRFIKKRKHNRSRPKASPPTVGRRHYCNNFRRGFWHTSRQDRSDLIGNTNKALRSLALVYVDLVLFAIISFQAALAVARSEQAPKHPAVNRIGHNTGRRLRSSAVLAAVLRNRDQRIN